MNLEKYICDLLYRHECVIVPEFGGFITNYEPAGIQSHTHTISPPRKYLVFNSGLKVNDGLLATEISSKLSCSFEEAMLHIRREVVAWQERLKAGKVIMLPGIGSFKLSKDSKIEFRPDKEQNFFDGAFGLTPLVAPPLQLRKSNRATFRNRKTGKPTAAKTIRRIAWAAAITIPLVTVAFWSLSNHDSLKQYAVQHSGIFHAPTPASSDPVNLADCINDTERSSVSENATDDIQPNAPYEAPAEEVAPVLQSIEEAKVRAYHIIIGSFENETNAKQLSDELSRLGRNALVVSSAKGMYRVSIDSYVDKQEALHQLQKLREEQNPNAWLLRI